MKHRQTTEEILAETPDAVAVIGAAVRFPGATDLFAYRALLASGAPAIQPVEPGIAMPEYYRQMAAQPNYVPVSATLTNVACFDAGFFGFTPREAVVMDPQQRHILECVWHAFENAGIIPGDEGEQRTAVFTSTAFSTYLSHLLMPRIYAGMVDVVEAGLANNTDFAASRVSYKLNLKGPALAIQTACSSSLVATHLACRSLAEHESDLAIVAAASITVPNGLGYLASDKGMVAVDGKCKPFLASATGTVFGNGAGAVLLRRLDQAVGNGDRIMAVIRGSAVNNDGGQRIGFTAPNMDGQSAVIAEANGVADVTPADIGYIEAHGTGTPLGDPIEISALYDAYGDLPHPIPIGTAKGQIGHLDTVAGLAGLVRVATIFDTQTIPATAEEGAPNPELELSRRPFRLVGKAEPWKSGAQARIAALSSFGMGGTNAHAILQEVPERKASAGARSHELIVLSGREALDADANCHALGSFFDSNHGINLADAAYTLRHGRKALSARRFCVVRNGEQASEALVNGRYYHGDASNRPKTAFVLPGQGSQYAELAVELVAAEPVFAKHYGRLRKLILHAGGHDIAAPGLDAEAAMSTQYAQAALFACGVALGRTLEAFSTVPDSYIGHSVGEVAVACLTGILSEKDACELVVARANAMSEAPRGAMVQLSCPEDAAGKLIAQVQAQTGLVLAPVAFNAPATIVAGGDFTAIEQLETAAESKGIDCIRLRTSHAFHTPMMQQAAARLSAITAHMPFNSSAIPVISTLTGQVAEPDMLSDPDYWAQQMLRPVQYGKALQTAIDDGISLFVELGPPGGLAASLLQMSGPPDTSLHSLALLPSRRQASQAGAQHVAFLQGIGTLWSAGRLTCWAGFDEPFLPRNRIELPGYAFRAEQHWPETEGAAETARQAGNAIEAARPNLALPRQARPESAEPFAAPSGDTEMMLAALWEDLLLIAPIGRNDDFIALGGASITALQLVQALAAKGHTITVREIFEHRVLAEIAARIRQAGNSACSTGQVSGPEDDPDEDSLDLETLATIRSRLKA
ncbi:type I polyketide synthase [Brucella pseudogrignonensis]|uniref:type I polyketide synthase n=1 Tax=Brucella pseudogrignonensis TaxID=419475 RepID=UPI0038B59162